VRRKPCLRRRSAITRARQANSLADRSRRRGRSRQLMKKNRSDKTGRRKRDMPANYTPDGDAARDKPRSLNGRDSALLIDTGRCATCCAMQLRNRQKRRRGLAQSGLFCSAMRGRWTAWQKACVAELRRPLCASLIVAWASCPCRITGWKPVPHAREFRRSEREG